MVELIALIRGGFLRASRTEVLGVATGIAGLTHALASWAVGDLTIFSLARAVGENWALIAAGFGLATLSAKIDRTGSGRHALQEKVSDIADAALRG